MERLGISEGGPFLLNAWPMAPCGRAVLRARRSSAWEIPALKVDMFLSRFPRLRSCSMLWQCICMHRASLLHTFVPSLNNFGLGIGADYGAFSFKRRGGKR